MVAEPSVFGVSRVVRYIRRLLSENKQLRGLHVRGEVTGRRESGGHLHFDLKENADLLKCFVWANTLPKLPLFNNGDEIICAGKFDAYPAQSKYELVVEELQLAGAGALFAQFEALRKRLSAEGLFDASRKRPFPKFPQRIAVISAPGGAGIEDFLKTMREGAGFVQMRRIDTRVQGEGAEIDIADAIDTASKMRVDAIVLTRGGGSYEDLFPFNREPVVRAILRAKHPVLTAIGHERDCHLSDLAADVVCDTPSLAAQYFVSLGTEWAGRVAQAQAKLNDRIGAVLWALVQRYERAAIDLTRGAAAYTGRKGNGLHLLARKLDQHAPHRRLRERVERIAHLRSRIDAVGRYVSRTARQRFQIANQQLQSTRSLALRNTRNEVEVLKARLFGVNPEAPLDRGYAIVTLEGRAVRDAAAVPSGSEIEAKVQRGKLFARVERSAP